jgi:hypothetical protein
MSLPRCVNRIVPSRACSKEPKDCLPSLGRGSPNKLPLIKADYLSLPGILSLESKHQMISVETVSLLPLLVVTLETEAMNLIAHPV